MVIMIGDRDLRKLAESGDAIDHAIAERLSERIWDGARRRAPVLTGYLRNHITRTVQVRTFDVTSEADYSSFNEWGTRRMAAHPYMIPAAEDSKPREIASDVLREYGIR